MFKFKLMSKTISSTVPRLLQQGDQVAIIATARYANLEAVAYSQELLETWGLVVLKGKNLLEKHYNFAGNDAQRLEDLQWAMDNKEIKAIFCFRGGYGTTRILQQLEPSEFIQNPKWVVGFSDVTALHNYLSSICNTSSVHATMPINYQDNSAEALQSLKNVLFHNMVEYSFAPNKMNRLGDAKGPVVGGNLAILQSLSGTKYDTSTAGKILFLEDVDEYLYNIDRMLWTLKHAGKLTNLNGLIVGGFTQQKDNEDPFGMTVEEIILEKVSEYNYPVCFDFPAGHFNNNCALPLGIPLQLRVGKNKVELTN